MTEFHLINPAALWLIMVAPLAGAAMWFAWRRNEILMSNYGDRKLIGSFSEMVPPARFFAKAALLAAGLFLLVLALARPSLRNGVAEFPQGTIDIITIVDVSRSMAVPDYKDQLRGSRFKDGRRLDMARHLIAEDLIPSLNYNKLGVVTYSGSAFPMAFLSDDMLAMKWVLERALVMGSAPGEGSEMDQAFELAFELFDLDSAPERRKIIVLFSDGGNDADTAEMHSIISQLSQRGIELIIVGLGKPNPTPIPVKLLSRGDQARFYNKESYEHEGQVVTSKLEENWLLLMRNMTGGRYVRVVDPSDFHIGNLISRVEVTYKTGEQELFFWPLLLAALAFVLALITPRALRLDNKPAYIFRSERGKTKQSGRKLDSSGE